MTRRSAPPWEEFTRMRLIPAIALFALVAGYAAPAAAAPDLVRTLPNKVTIIVREVTPPRMGAIRAWVRAGSRDEAVKDRGIAALTAQCIGEATGSREEGI